MLTPGVKLIGRQACLPGRTPLLLAAGSITYQTKSSALDTQLLPSHQPLQVSTNCPDGKQYRRFLSHKLGKSKASLAFPVVSTPCTNFLLHDSQV